MNKKLFVVTWLTKITRGVMDRAPASQLGDPGSNPTSAKNSYVKNG